MHYFILLITGCLAILGAWLLTDFFMWQARGKKTAARIDGFQRSGRWPLPVLAFISETGREIKVKAQRVDSLIYLLGKPKEGDAADIIYIEEENAPLRARVFGYLPAGAGGLMILSLVGAIGMTSGKAMLTTQVFYIMIFAVIFCGGLALLKFIYRN